MANFNVQVFVKRYKIYDIICLIVLLAIALTTFSFLFNSQPFIYDDNSFHYFTFHYAVTQSIPIHHRLIDWNPYWFAGIPELQFYPPGSIFIGIFLYYLCLTLVPIGQIYNLVLLFALLFPVVTSYYLLRKTEFTIFASFFTAFAFLILLELGNASGVFYGVLVGLTNSRIALGFYPLILWFGIKNLIAKPRKRNIAGLAILFAISLLCHPYHIFLPICGLIAQIYAFKRTRLCSLRQSIKVFGLAILLGFGLSAFWWLPLLIRHNFVSSLQIWSGGGTELQFQSLIGLLSSLAAGKTNFFYLILYLISALSLLNPNQPFRQKAILAGMVVTPLLMLGFLIFVQIILIPVFHFYFLDVVRLKDGFYFAVIITSGIGIYALLEYGYKKLKETSGTIPKYVFQIIAMIIFILTLIVLISQILLIGPFYNFSRGYAKIGFLPTMVIEYQLDNLWAYLNKSAVHNLQLEMDSGRILFTASSLKYKNLPAQFQTHIMSLTPIYTDRQIIGGLNTPFYTVASYLFFGKKAPIVIRTEADSLDNKSLFGIPWDQMQEPIFAEFCKKLNITDFVVNRNEDNVIAFFSRCSTFKLEKEIDEFQIYTSLNYEPNWIEYDKAIAEISVTAFKPDSITLAVNSAATSVPVLIKLAYYPCWYAYFGNTRIPITTDEIGLMQLVLPQGNRYQINLVYQLDWVERFGWIISCIAFALMILGFILHLQKRNQ